MRFWVPNPEIEVEDEESEEEKKGEEQKEEKKVSFYLCGRLTLSRRRKMTKSHRLQPRSLLTQSLRRLALETSKGRKSQSLMKLVCSCQGESTISTSTRSS